MKDKQQPVEEKYIPQKMNVVSLLENHKRNKNQYSFSLQFRFLKNCVKCENAWTVELSDQRNPSHIFFCSSGCTSFKPPQLQIIHQAYNKVLLNCKAVRRKQNMQMNQMQEQHLASCKQLVIVLPSSMGTPSPEEWKERLCSPPYIEEKGGYKKVIRRQGN